MTRRTKENPMSPTTNYARHVGRPALPAEPGTVFKPWERRKGKVAATREVVFFSGAAPAQCVPQEEWAFYRRPWPPAPFAGRIVGESGT